MMQKTKRFRLASQAILPTQSVLPDFAQRQNQITSDPTLTPDSYNAQVLLDVTVPVVAPTLTPDSYNTGIAIPHQATLGAEFFLEF